MRRSILPLALAALAALAAACASTPPEQDPVHLKLNDLDTAVLGPGGFVVPGDGRTFLAVAHRRDLCVGGPLKQQRPANRLGATLAEAEVGFA